MNGRRFASRFALPVLLALGVLPAPALAAEPAGSPKTKLSAEERLDAIRHGLVQAALEGATRVDSVAWLDAEGRLQESSSFRSGMQVRGVQVLAYVRDPEGQPRARLQLPAANPAPAARTDVYLETPSKAAQACPSGEGLRHVIGLELAVAGRWSAQDAPMAHAMGEIVSTMWLQSDRSAAAATAAGLANWRMLGEGETLIGANDEPSRTAYEQVLLSKANLPPLPWRASIQIVPGPQAAAPRPAFWQPLLGQPPAAPAVARISLTLQAHGPSQAATTPTLTVAADVPLLREASQWGAPQFSPAGRAQLEALLARWSAAISAQLACEPVRPEILPTAKGMLRLNVGALAGVKPGEEWLLADPAAFPERLLAPGVAQQLVLAKVHQVHARHADLHILAGPTRPIQPGWRAWRAESPLGDLVTQP